MTSASSSSSIRSILASYIPTVILAAGLFCTSPAVHAQMTLNVTDTTSTPQPGTGHDYIHGVNETVNPANGSLSLRFEIPVRKGRGITLPISIGYDSNGLATLQDSLYGPTVYYNISPCYSANGWSYTLPCLSAKHSSLSVPINMGEYETCYWNDNFTFYDPSGGRHALNLLAAYASNATPGEDCPQTTGTQITGGDVYYTASTGSDTDGFKQTQVADSDGTVYTFSPALVSSTPYDSNTTFYTALPVSIEDRNGNEITLNGGSYRDTLGTPAISINGTAILTGAGTDTIGVNGSSQLYSIAWGSPTTTNYSIAFTSMSPGDVNCYNISPTHMGIQIAQVQSISLPNGEQYKFSYNPIYGTVSAVTYPNGASVVYDWGIIPAFASSYFRYTQETTIWSNITPYTSYCAYNYDVVGIKGRHVFMGSTEVLTQTFSYTTPTYFESPTTTTVTTTDNLRGNTSTATITYNKNFVPPNGFSPQISNGPVSEPTPGFTSVESSESVTDYSGSLLQTTSKSWYPSTTSYNANLLQGEQTVLQVKGSTLTSQTDYCYGRGGVITEKDEYGYGASLPTTLTCPPTVPTPAPTRSTVTTYQPFGATLAYPAAQSIFNLPCSSITYDKGSRAAEIDYLYDGESTTCGTAGTPSVASAGGLPLGTHDEANYSASSSSPRGNATTVTTQCFPSCNNHVATYAYDETGQITSMTDTLNNTTKYSFADSSNGSGDLAGNSNAYLTQITYPPVNGVTLQKNFQYNYVNGYLTSAEDENGQFTTYAYDSLNRLKETDHPDGGKTTVSYNDAVPDVTTSVLMNSSSNEWMTNIATMDGMGHVIRTELSTDPDGPSYVDTTYDGAGRVFTKTNPYRTTSSGQTTYYYDALGRPTKTAEQDSSILQWCYNGNPSLYNASAICSGQLGGVAPGTWVDSTDEVGNHWQRTSDAFGRMTEVMEPNGASQTPSMETDYTYDALNNLWSVKQCGALCSSQGPSGAISRTFSYNSLSQLLTAFNPEAGAVNYAYDPNGNLHTKTDARSVITTYQYDALNRLLSKSYSDGATPLSCYQYDTSSATPPAGVQPNWKARLTNAWTLSASLSGGACTGNGLLTKRSILAYDQIGRITYEQQLTPASQASGKIYPPAYTYDLAGNLISSTDGVTPTSTGTTLVFSYCYGGAGRLETVTSNWGDSSHPQSLFSAQVAPCPQTNSSIVVPSPGYAAFGGLANAIFGNTALTQVRNYDPRLRVTSENDTGTVVATPTSGSTTVTITGSEQSK